jgi:hypothetical protein
MVEAQTWAKELHVLIMPKPAGANGTIRAALADAFTRSDYVIHVEDDVLLAADALPYFRWARRYGADPEVWTVAAWRHARGWLPGCGREMMADEIAMARKQPFFTCWGWATWRDRWREMESNWTQGGDHELSWDVRMEQMRGGRVQVCPMISRAVNIGKTGGIHRGDSPLAYWRAASSTAPVQSFFEG